MADPQTPAKEEKKEEPRHEAEYLVTNARSLLNSRPAIVAGALAAQDRKTHTMDQAKEAVRKFQSPRRAVALASGAQPDEQEEDEE